MSTRAWSLSSCSFRSLICELRSLFSWAPVATGTAFPALGARRARRLGRLVELPTALSEPPLLVAFLGLDAMVTPSFGARGERQVVGLRLLGRGAGRVEGAADGPVDEQLA